MIIHSRPALIGRPDAIVPSDEYYRIGSGDASGSEVSSATPDTWAAGSSAGTRVDWAAGTSSTKFGLYHFTVDTPFLVHFSFEFRIQEIAVAGDLSGTARVYFMEEDWDPTTVTYNTRPALPTRYAEMVMSAPSGSTLKTTAIDIVEHLGDFTCRGLCVALHAASDRTNHSYRVTANFGAAIGGSADNLYYYT